MDDKLGLPEDRWSKQYMGTASFVQVKGLRPGRTYAALVAAVPVVTTPHQPGEVVVVPSPHSEVVTVQTLPCPPMGQPAPQLASRLKKELKVGGHTWLIFTATRGMLLLHASSQRQAAQLSMCRTGLSKCRPPSCFAALPAVVLPYHLQFKWAEPEETGGRPLEYVLEVGSG